MPHPVRQRKIIANDAGTWQVIRQFRIEIELELENLISRGRYGVGQD
jgi:hypothetical protein